MTASRGSPLNSRATPIRPPRPRLTTSFILSGQKNAFPNTQTGDLGTQGWYCLEAVPQRSHRHPDRRGNFSQAERPAPRQSTPLSTARASIRLRLATAALLLECPVVCSPLAASANQTLLTQFASGGSFNSISAALPGGFAPPTFYSLSPIWPTSPKFYRWNFEVQQGLGAKMVFSANYKGNHGIRIPILDGGLNAYCSPTDCPGGFAGLPAAPPNPALGQVNQFLSGASSSYNGLTLSLERRMANNVAFNASYTWSHSLDSVSNGGSLLPFGILATNESVTNMQDPRKHPRQLWQFGLRPRGTISAPALC